MSLLEETSDIILSQTCPLESALQLPRDGEMEGAFSLDEARMEAIGEELKLCDGDEVTASDHGEADVYDADGSQRYYAEKFEDFSQSFREMENITKDGGIRKKVVYPGLGLAAKLGDRVKFHYQARAESVMEPYDDTWLRGRPMVCQLELADDGTIGILEGLMLALLTMCRQEVSEFVFHPRYMYGKRGLPPRIPGDRPVLMRIKLLDVSEKLSVDGNLDANTYLDYKTLKAEDVFKKVEEIRQDCKETLKLKDARYVSAFRRYKYATNLLENCKLSNDDEEAVMLALLTSCYVNTALCLFNMCKYDGAISLARQALKLDTKNAKAHFWLAKCFIARQEFSIANHHLKEALTLKPNDKDIQKLMRELSTKESLCRENERLFCQNAFKSMFKKPEPGGEHKVQETTGVAEAGESVAGAEGGSVNSFSLSADDRAGTGARRKQPQHAESEVEDVLANADPDFILWAATKLSEFASDRTRCELKLPENLSKKELICVAKIAENFDLNPDVHENFMVVRKNS